MHAFYQLDKSKWLTAAELCCSSFWLAFLFL